MNTNTATAARICNLHLTEECATCFKYASQCDFGACRKTATQKIGPEARPSCTKHVKDIARNY